jgi:tRNA(fMet)-specific endonuclease VapC
MARVMLDTDICVDVMRGRTPAVRSRLERTVPGEVAVSAIVAAELWTGVMKSHRTKVAEDVVREFLSYVEVLDWPVEAGRVYGGIRARLEASGNQIGAMDLLIAAHAIHEKAALVTRNLAEFRRVAGLRIENWAGTV